jgi:hypothetical protein
MNCNTKWNTFSDISPNNSVLVLRDTFSSVLFNYNTFSNVNSSNAAYEGGVYFILFIFFYFILIYFIFFY